MRFLKLCALFVIFVSTTAHAGDFVRMAGWGKTEESALHSAFVKAIELEMGVMVLSDRDTKKNIQVKNDIYAYSAGYVDDYKIITSNPTSDGVSVIVDVKVSSSKIKNQILMSNEKTKDLNGDLASARFNTYKHTRDSADALLTKALKSFPENAYKIELRKSEIKAGNYRQAVVDIEFSISLEDKFLSNLSTTLALMDNSNNRYYASKVVFDNWAFLPILDHRDTFFIEDSVTDDLLRKHLNPKIVRVNISLNSDDETLYSVCRPVDTFVKIVNNKITLFPGHTKYYGVMLSDAKVSKILENVTNVKISTVNVKDCKNESTY